jgi:hypothetical protein
MAMVDRHQAQANPDCECLTLAVRDVESFARGRGHRAIERVVIRALIVLSRSRSGLVRLPDLSLGPYQLKVSTVARFHSIPIRQLGRWVRIEGEAARQVVAECFAEPLAAGHAKRRIREALEFGESIGLDPFAATAMVYSGELPTALFNPYQARIRVRYLIRHRSCGAQGGESPNQEFNTGKTDQVIPKSAFCADEEEADPPGRRVYSR